MSAGKTGEYPGEPPIVVHADVRLLAPKMQAAITAMLAECQEKGLDAVVHESYRDGATAAVYYKRGRTQTPPTIPVTNAPNETWSWHGYGLACDIISKAKGWDVSALWFAKMGAIAKKHGLKWGGDWKQHDLPHVQWAQCKASPSDEARRILKEEGMTAVWTAVGAV